VNERRLRRLVLPVGKFYSLFHALQHGTRVEFRGLPEEFYFSRFAHDLARDAFVIYVGSDEFEPVPDGEEIPLITEWSIYHDHRGEVES
jgi:hypothetical protein